MGPNIISSQHCKNEYWKCKLRSVFGDEPSNDDVDRNGDSKSVCFFH